MIWMLIHVKSIPSLGFFIFFYLSPHVQCSPFFTRSDLLARWRWIPPTFLILAEQWRMWVFWVREFHSVCAMGYRESSSISLHSEQQAGRAVACREQWCSVRGASLSLSRVGRAAQLTPSLRCRSSSYTLQANAELEEAQNIMCWLGRREWSPWNGLHFIHLF